MTAYFRLTAVSPPTFSMLLDAFLKFHRLRQIVTPKKVKHAFSKFFQIILLVHLD